MIDIKVPDHYGWVVLGAGFFPVITGLMLGHEVMNAREKYNVHLPNLYAIPGVHEKADEFNRVQRGHQNYLEYTDSYAVMTLLGGLKHPIACAIGAATFNLGSYLYMLGYADSNLDVEDARYRKGGVIKWIGYLVSLYSCGSFGYSLVTAKK